MNNNNDKEEEVAKEILLLAAEEKIDELKDRSEFWKAKYFQALEIVRQYYTECYCGESNHSCDTCKQAHLEKTSWEAQQLHTDE